MGWWSFQPRMTAAQRRAKAVRAAARLAKNGRKLSPVKIEGRAIAATFWGKAWCDNLESYSDFENRLPRGRTYARNGSVLDLQIEAGKVKAVVSGSEVYNVTIDITAHRSSAWNGLKKRCAGQIGSLVELLQGKLSKGVMDLVTARDGGLFPMPKEIKISCSCPDWAGLCKHAAAVLYGVGARFDHEPELLFKLRKVDHLELITEAGSSAAFAKSSSKGKKVLAESELSDVFGIEFSGNTLPAAETRAIDPPVTKKPRRNVRKTAAAPSANLGETAAAPISATKKPALRRPRNAATVVASQRTADDSPSLRRTTKKAKSVTGKRRRTATAK